MNKTTEKKLREFEKLMKYGCVYSSIADTDKELLRDWIESAIKEAVEEKKEEWAKKWDQATSVFYCEHCGKFMTQKQQKKLSQQKGSDE